MVRTPEGECYRGGDGPPLLLLHSGFMTWVEWRGLIDALGGQRRILAPTLPGSDGGPGLDLNNRTMLQAHADYVEQLLDEEGWGEPVSVVGSSFGSVLGLELAARGRAADVVALAPPWVSGAGVPFYFAAFMPVYAAFRLAKPVHERVAASPRAFASLMLGSLRPAEISTGDATAVLRSFARFPMQRFLRPSLLGGPGMPDVDAITVPATLVWGTADRLVPGWMRDRWEEALPDARVINLDGFPHTPHLRDPVVIAGLIAGSQANAAG